jgi:hypothetical protein
MAKEVERSIRNARIVLFAPQIMDGVKVADGAKTYCDNKLKDKFYVIPDAYTDLKYPDVYSRTMLAWDVVRYYVGKDQEGALSAIRSLLAKVADGVEQITGIEDLFKIERPLRIKPINFKVFSDYQKAMEAVATAL